MLPHILAVVSNVPVTTPAQQVVKETLQPVVQPIAQTPAVVLQLSAIAATAASAFVISLFHQLATSKISWLKDNVNRIVVALYTVGIALVAAYEQGQLRFDTAGWVTITVSLAVALATALGRYQFFQFLTALVGNGNKTITEVDQALATELPAEDEIAVPTASF